MSDIVSVTVQEICECFVILFLSLEAATVDSTGELPLRCGGRGQVASLSEDLLSVGVGGFVHVTSIGTGTRDLGG